VAIYSGDDARFEYVYKFLSKGSYRHHDRQANLDLLDAGTLYVARFDAGDVTGDDLGTGVWLELSPANPALADWTLADILLNTRGAADVVGATPMDRPEDIEVSPQTDRVYIALTNNSRRTEPNEANPRVDNQHGHIIELIEAGGDAGALTFHWNILIKCGDPAVPAHDTGFGDLADPVAAGVSPISDPDNLVHDDDGNLWIATDGQFFSDSVGFGQNDGIFAVPVEGSQRGLLRQFLSGVPGGEVCGPEFSGDNKTLFCAIQHPHDGRAFEQVWPIGDPDCVSKPSLIAIRERHRRKIGS
jgi:secreted PhoX family phosphatase